MGDYKLSYYLMDIILFIVFIGLINTVFNLSRTFFVLEFLFLLVMGFFAIISMIAVYNNANWGWKFLFAILGLILIDLLFISYFMGKPSWFYTMLFTGLFGFLISVAYIKKKEVEHEDPEEVDKEVTKEFKPGKLVGSKSGSKYHIPKCDWAKRIKKSNQVWFESEAEAKKKGYKADNCLKEKVYKNF